MSYVRFPRSSLFSALRVLIALGVAGAAVAHAQTGGGGSGQPPPIACGGDVRLRNEYFNHAFALSAEAPLHEQDYLRVRTRLWLAANAGESFSFYGRLASEPRRWMKPAFVKQHAGATGTEWRYILPDSLYVKWKGEIEGSPVTLTVGRQEIFFGDPLDWWLIAEGTPGDGSWTFFFDAARLTWQAKPLRTQFDLIGIAQRGRPDSALPIVGAPLTYGVTEQNEQGFILYATNQSLPDTQLEGYYIYKQDRQTFAAGDNADLHTFGGKASRRLAPNWRASVESAWQGGHKQDASVKTPIGALAAATARREVRAFGGTGRLTYLFQDAHNHQLSLVYEYLSGDRPGTPGRDEMFDVLWGRWPRFSELYIYSYPMETSGKIAQRNNLERYGFTWNCTPVAGTAVSATYNVLVAPQTVPTRQINATLFTQTGHWRGDYYQLTVKHQFAKNISGHLWGEWVRQGNYYTHRNTLTFLRAELMFAF